MTTAELSTVENIVNDAITAALPVYNEVVPLKQAMEIAGLRAVFGEKYPDPVRVVSVGHAVRYTSTLYTLCTVLYTLYYALWYTLSYNLILDNTHMYMPR